MFLGYNDISTLPVKKGNQVYIPKGTLVKSMHPQKGNFISKRGQWVSVHHMGCGQTVPEDDYDRHYKHNFPDAPKDLKYEERFNQVGYATMNPTVVWPGAGGYWCEVDINIVLNSGKEIR